MCFSVVNSELALPSNCLQFKNCLSKRGKRTKKKTKESKGRKVERDEQKAEGKKTTGARQKALNRE